MLHAIEVEIINTLKLHCEISDFLINNDSLQNFIWLPGMQVRLSHIEIQNELNCLLCELFANDLL